jgi:hypothetical protein
LPATFGYVAPDGGSPWHEVQLSDVSGEPVWWHTVQRGATEFGEMPVTAWHAEQSVLNLVWSVVVWVAPWKGTEWFTPPGPPEWQVTPLKEAEKQLGALGSCPVPGPSALWQMTHATPRFPESRWEAM